ncbi:MAG: hypothetical protein JRG73_01250 [Deltaproteobacteria bacterium]|nr:hypothetical protein [Deltaproteobacteria bacterium]MBW2305531.1 hypothetical protein [Deltaproteobacteria bacterium]
MEKTIEYFDSSGPNNTERTLELARLRADELGIDHLVLSSSTGRTAVRAMELIQPERLVVVSSMYGMREPGRPRITGDNRTRLEEAGVRLVFQTHVLSGIERAINNKFQGLYPALLVAEVLRIFGQGWKVCFEITMMAADSGAIPADKEVVAMGGTGKGLDTALVMSPAHSNTLFDLSVREIICTPRGKQHE